MKLFHVPIGRLALFFSCFVSFFANTQGAGQKIDPQFCGNKHKNLALLQSIMHNVPGVAIPEFIGVPSTRVENFLNRHAPTCLADFNNVVKCSLNDPSLRSAKTIITQMQEKIKACFTNVAFTFTPTELALFEKMCLQKQFFMVRSTGIEDGAIANAGGNASIAYVLPTPQAIQSAMGEVVASYFGLQSLKSRMSNGEQLSSTDLCLSVLIQVLVGETLDGARDEQSIPVSGVAYTTNQSLSTSNFCVTEINAAYGHGEGVVANRVTADRYYVTASRLHNGTALYPMIYHKSERLVPHYTEQTNHELIIKTNSDELAHKSALSQDQIKHLYAALKQIEAAYKQPMDVEFVVLNTALYIVQARPAMYVPAQPSYIALATIDQNDISSPVFGNTIVPGRSSVIITTNPDDIIVAKTIDEADQMANSTTCKLVIVGTWASSLSHPAVNFKTYGIPCMVVQDISAVRKMIAQVSPANPCVFDAQQRCLFIGRTPKDFNDYIEQGWLEHPIDRTYCLLTNSMNEIKTPACHVPHDGKLIAALEQFKKEKNHAKQAELLQSIVDIVQQRLALTERRLTFFDNLCPSEFKTTFLAYKTAFETVVQECSASIQQHAEHFEILFYHKMIEALLYQAADTQKVIGGYTYSYFLNDLYTKQAIFLIKRRLGTNSLDFAEYFQ